MALQLFEKQFGSEDINLHEKYKLIRDDPLAKYKRDILLQWTEGFIDRDNKIIKEFQTSFHSAFWEFYLFNYFKKLKFDIDFTYNRPDFLIKQPQELTVEAVVAEIKKNGTEEKSRNLDDIVSMVTPPYLIENFEDFIDEAITRYSNSILNKSSAYKLNYLNCSWVKQETPFIIALASYSQINYGREFIYPMITLLYGFKYDPIKNKYDKIQKITKPETESSIPVGLFEKEEYKHISAIIFSCTLTLGKLESLAISENNQLLNSVITIRLDNEQPFYKIQKVSKDSPEDIDDGLFIFYNPNAINKINDSIFQDSNIVKVNVKNNELIIDSKSLPLVARLNVPLNSQLLEILIRDIAEKYNPRFITSVFQILEIDFDIEPKEITLYDKIKCLPVYVDITDHDVKLLQDKNILTGDEVLCAIYSQSSIGQATEIWHLHSIDKINKL